MSKTLEVIKALSEPTMKLMDMVGSAIGTAYEPRHKRKMADATAYEISVVGNAMRNAADLPVLYNQEGVVINSEDFNRLMQRAGTRLALQETIKQYNIESVVDNAYDILETEDHCSSDPVDQGWINRFFDSVADVSDEDLQKLWGKVLAGEIIQPKSYSLRTLETLKNLSKYEAELFQKIAPYIIEMNGNLFLPSNTDFLGKHGIAYGEIIKLDECGLINSGALVSLNPPLSNDDKTAFHNRSKIVFIHSIVSEDVKISIGEFGLTSAGKELFYILDCVSNDGYLYEFAETVANSYSKKLRMTVHQINYIKRDRINYEEEALYEFPNKGGATTE